MINLSNKVALITGASSGIGEATAILMAELGAKVVVAARRKEKLDALVAQLTDSKKVVHAVKLDVTHPEEITHAVQEAVSTYGRLDILVNNAGVAEFSPLTELSEEEWDRTIDTNLKGYFLMSREVAKEMIKNKWGRIINVSSIAMGGQGVGFPNIAHYCASKGGAVGLTEALAVELAPHTILVNAVSPGVIATEMTRALLDDPKQKDGLLSRIPLKRAGTATEVASLIAYLSSDHSSYITGSTFVIDGGWLAG